MQKPNFPMEQAHNNIKMLIINEIYKYQSMGMISPMDCEKSRFSFALNRALILGTMAMALS